MVEVIKYGKKRREICSICGALLEFEKSDVSCVNVGPNEYEYVIVCPVCNEKVVTTYNK